MIAKVAEHLYERKAFANMDLGVDSNWALKIGMIFKIQ